MSLTIWILRYIIIHSHSHSQITDPYIHCLFFLFLIHFKCIHKYHDIGIS
jgi:hypothetical protein